MTVVTRFPPSPTGYFHIGSARTVLFNYLFAKRHGGTMVFRLEDTDQERHVEEGVASLIDGMSWLGITYDNEEIYKQSERTEVYKKHLQRLVDAGHAYEAEESKNGEGKVVRFKNPNKEITFHDEIRGDITFDTTELGDFVIARTMHDPLYHLTVVVDDYEMGVTHVIRGDDHISNTPRQILILEGLGAPRPVYAHIPLILNKDRSKMSKRKNPVDIARYKDSGYLSEAIINYLALLGWNPGTDQELFSLEALVEHFDLAQVQKSPAIFDLEKLRWVNKQYVKELSCTAFVEHALPHWRRSREELEHVLPVVQERIEVFEDIAALEAEGEFAYFFETPTYDVAALAWKKSTPEEAQKHLNAVHKMLAQLDSVWNADTVRETLWDYAEEHGKGDVLWPMRYALSGKDKSPDPFTLASLLGKEDTLTRIAVAAEQLSAKE